MVRVTFGCPCGHPDSYIAREADSYALAVRDFEELACEMPLACCATCGKLVGLFFVRAVDPPSAGPRRN
jgi:hypothetical protein